MASPGEMALLNAIMQNQTSRAQTPSSSLGILPGDLPGSRDAPHDYSSAGGLFDRLFPKRDPMTGEQGGILANPLFRLGLNLLARSGPAPRPHSLGQDIAGAVNDYSGQRDQEVTAADASLKHSANVKNYGELNAKDAWAADFDFQKMLQGLNPTGNPDALSAQTPTIPGMSPSYFKNLVRLESGGDPNAKNPGSTASGPAQFTDFTRAWIDKQGGFNSNDRSPEAEQKRLEYFTDVNRKNLQFNGMPVNDTTLYLSHLLGSRGARDFLWALNQDPTMSAEKRLGPDVVAKNKRVFGGKNLQQVYDYIGQSIGSGSWGVPQAQAQVPSGPSVQPAAAPAPQPQVAAQPAQFPPMAGGQPAPVAQAAPTPLVPPAAPQSISPVAPASVPSPQTPGPAAGGPASPQGQTQAPTPQLEYGPDGKITKNSILNALQVLPQNVRNQIILGAWMKASGNKREFAENLGEALLGLATKKSAIDTSGYIVGQPFNVRHDDGTVSTYVVDKTGAVRDLTNELGGGHRTTTSDNSDFNMNDPEDASLIQQIAKYQMPISALGKPGTPRYVAGAALVQQLNPKFIEGESKNIAKAVNSYTTGQVGATNTALGTSIQHLEQLRGALKDLNPTNVQLFNKVKNWLFDQFGAPEPLVAKGTKVIVADEVVRAIIRGVGAAVDRGQVQQILAEYHSDGQNQKMIDALQGLIAQRLDGQRRAFNNATKGLAPEMFDNMFDPEVLSVLNNIQKNKKPLGSSSLGPNIKSVVEEPSK